jgi:hypothetical protein
MEEENRKEWTVRRKWNSIPRNDKPRNKRYY